MGPHLAPRKHRYEIRFLDEEVVRCTSIKGVTAYLNKKEIPITHSMVLGVTSDQSEKSEKRWPYCHKARKLLKGIEIVRIDHGEFVSTKNNRDWFNIN